MQHEIEVKFLRVEFDDVRARLKKAGAVLEHPMRLMRRALIEPQSLIDQGRNVFLRVRDEGDRVTLTYKERKDTTIMGTYEIETTVGDYETTLRLFEALGYEFKTDQETRRETWRLGTSEIVLDEWPWVAPFVEIEGESEASVRETAEVLGFDWKERKIGSIKTAVLDQYPALTNRGFIDVPVARFGDPVPKAFGKAVY